MNSCCFRAKRLTPRTRAHGPLRWPSQGKPLLKMPFWFCAQSKTQGSPHWGCAQGQVCSWDLPGRSLHNLHPDTSWPQAKRIAPTSPSCLMLPEVYQGSLQVTDFPGQGKRFNARGSKGCRVPPTSCVTLSKLQKSLVPQFLNLHLEDSSSASPVRLPCGSRRKCRWTVEENAGTGLGHRSMEHVDWMLTSN